MKKNEDMEPLVICKSCLHWKDASAASGYRAARRHSFSRMQSRSEGRRTQAQERAAQTAEEVIQEGETEMTEKTMTDIRILQNMMARTNSVKEKTALSDAIVLFSRQEPKGKAYTGRPETPSLA